MQHLAKLLILSLLVNISLQDSEQRNINFLTGDSYVKNIVTKESINEINAIGSGAEEMEKRFEKWRKQNPGNFTYQSWNNLRVHDGALCRNDLDCSWIDENLVCYEPQYMNLIPNVSTAEPRFTEEPRFE